MLFILRLIDAAYLYRWSSVVCLSVCLSVGHIRETCKNGRTDQDAVWGLIAKPRNQGPMYHIWSRFPHVKGQFGGCLVD